MDGGGRSSLCRGSGPGLESQQSHNVRRLRTQKKKTLHDQIFTFMKSVFVSLLFGCRSMTKLRELDRRVELMCNVKESFVFALVTVAEFIEALFVDDV